MRRESVSVKVAIIALFLALTGGEALYAQSWKDRVRKEGAEYLRKALGKAPRMAGKCAGK